MSGAIGKFNKSLLAKKILGKHCFERLPDSNIKEWNKYRLKVSLWELDNNLEKY